MKARFLSFILNLLLAFTVLRVSCVSDDEQPSSSLTHNKRPDLFSQRVPNFLQRFNFLNEHNQPLSEQEYMRWVARASRELDASYYYTQQRWNAYEQRGVQMLQSEGDTRRRHEKLHPSFVEIMYSNFQPRPIQRPYLYKKISDLDPQNPMRNANPDVALFMHAQRLFDYTKAQYQLRLYAILRLKPQRYLRRLHSYSTVAVPPSLPKGWLWPYDQGSRLSYRMLAYTERFGYDPLNLQKQIIHHHSYNNPSIYNDPMRIRTFLQNAQTYLKQFDSTSKEAQFRHYAVVNTIIDRQEPTFFVHTPLFDSFQPHIPNGIHINQYRTASSQLKPSMDRIVFFKKGIREQHYLVPTQIIRPMQIDAYIDFKTIATVPPDFQHQFRLRFHNVIPTVGRNPNLRVDHKLPDGSFFDENMNPVERPLGHPHSLYPYQPNTEESQDYQETFAHEPVPSTQQLSIGDAIAAARRAKAQRTSPPFDNFAEPQPAQASEDEGAEGKSKVPNDWWLHYQPPPESFPYITKYDPQHQEYFQRYGLQYQTGPPDHDSPHDAYQHYDFQSPATPQYRDSPHYAYHPQYDLQYPSAPEYDQHQDLHAEEGSSSVHPQVASPASTELGDVASEGMQELFKHLGGELFHYRP